MQRPLFSFMLMFSLFLSQGALAGNANSIGNAILKGVQSHTNPSTSSPSTKPGSTIYGGKDFSHMIIA